jgi:hypothetical protein
MPEGVHDNAGQCGKYNSKKRTFMPGEKRQMLLARGSGGCLPEREFHFVQRVRADDD